MLKEFSPPASLMYIAVGPCASGVCGKQGRSYNRKKGTVLRIVLIAEVY